MLESVDANRLTDRLVGASPQMELLRQQVAQLACCDVGLLLEGESGVGKELISRTVHGLSNRSEGPFVGVNCAAIHESLLESELFGHEAGAFTGADRSAIGFLRAADGGTILLDEVGDMSSTLQSKLLRVLQERAVIPVGGTEPVGIDIRVIAATNKDLADAVERGTFRKDLYYRLNVVCMKIPPLRERREDIRPLVEHLLVEMAEVLAMPTRAVSAEAMAMLFGHDWPGNVRELGNVIQRAYALGQGSEITPDDLPEQLRPNKRCCAVGDSDGFPSLKEATRRHVRLALEASDGVRSQAARLLEIDRKSLWRMMRRYDIS